MTTTELPDKPSELIRLAIKDLEACEKSDAYTTDMLVWHRPSTENEKCIVCFAGAVMANTLGADPKTRVEPPHFGEDIEAKLDALDSFKCGEVEEAMEELCVDSKLLDREVSRYDEGREKQFKSDMLDLADELEAEGN